MPGKGYTTVHRYAADLDGAIHIIQGLLSTMNVVYNHTSLFATKNEWDDRHVKKLLACFNNTMQNVQNPTIDRIIFYSSQTDAPWCDFIVRCRSIYTRHCGCSSSAFNV